MCHYLGGGLHGRKKRVKAQSESSKSVVNSVLISREMPVFPGFLEIIRVVKNNSRTNVKTGTLESNTSYESSRSDDARFEIAADIHFFGQDAPKPPHLSTSNVRVILKD